MRKSYMELGYPLGWIIIVWEKLRRGGREVGKRGLGLRKGGKGKLKAGEWVRGVCT